jgi:hypothetical protein
MSGAGKNKGSIRAVNSFNIRLDHSAIDRQCDIEPVNQLQITVQSIIFFTFFFELLTF